MTRLPTFAVCCLAAGTALSAATGVVTKSDAHEQSSSNHGGLRCVIVTRDLGSAVEISGKVVSDRAAHGTYDLRIRKAGGGGSAMIDQSGDFSVARGRTVTLGQATLGGSARHYKADLSVKVGGRALKCHSASSAKDI